MRATRQMNGNTRGGLARFGALILLILGVGTVYIGPSASAAAAEVVAPSPPIPEPSTVAPAKPTFSARAKVLVLPVVVAGGSEPSAALVEALAKGLRENLNWDVTVPVASTPEAANGNDESAMNSAVAAADAVPSGAGAASAATLAPVFAQLTDASAKAPLGAKGTAALIKIGSALVSAQVAAGQDEAARQTATDLKLLLPGRALTEASGLSFVAAAVVAAAPVGGVQTELRSHPPQCAIEINGTPVGKGVVQVALRPATRYSVQARCEVAQGASTVDSFPRVVSVQAADASAAEGAASGPPKFVLDASFPKNLKVTPSGLVVFFDSSERRMAMEESYVRRIAERFGASSVVLASVGEFQSTEWLNARLYLSSGYKNRHGLVRLEVPRATSLGRYLATGRESPGVLNAEEAGNMVASSRTLKQLAPAQAKRAPWYADVAGWSFIAAGGASLGLGAWANAAADDRRQESARSIDDPFRQDQLNADASNLKFYGGIGTFGGLIFIGTGVVLLALPEFGDTHSELYGFSPVPGGGQFSYRGRF